MVTTYGQFDRAHSQSVTAGTTETLTDCTVNVPPQLKFRITGFANYVGQTAALGNIVWKVLINGIARVPLHNIADIIGDQAQPWPVAHDGLVASGGDQVTVTATNSGGVSYDVGARLVGEFYREA